jgi:hypothetical protein
MKRIILKTLIGFIAIFALYLIVIFIFGDKAPLKTEVAKTPELLKVEQLPAGSSITSDNLSAKFSAQVAKEIIEKNPEGPITQDDKRQITAIPPDQAIQNAIEEAIRDFDSNKLRAVVDNTRIVIQDDVSKESLREYFTKLNDILGKLTEVRFATNTDPLPSDYQALASAYLQAEQDLYKVSVPRTALSFHTKQIAFLGTEKNILRIAANYENDPLQALLVLQFNSIIVNESRQLISEINAFIDKQKLNS